MRSVCYGYWLHLSSLLWGEPSLASRTEVGLAWETRASPTLAIDPKLIKSEPQPRMPLISKTVPKTMASVAEGRRAIGQVSTCTVHAASDNNYFLLHWEEGTSAHLCFTKSQPSVSVAIKPFTGSYTIKLNNHTTVAFLHYINR